jgi:hypothetical protein
MRPAPIFLVALGLLAVPRVGQTQGMTRDLQRSQQIQQKASSLSAAPPAAPALPQAPALQTPDPQPVPQGMTTSTVPPAAAPSGLPSANTLPTQNEPLSPVSSLDTPTATSNIDPNANPFKAKMRVPDYEARYRAAMLAEKKKQEEKKSLMNAIFEEVTNYGLYFLLGLVLFLVLYALRKEPSKAGPPKTILSSGPKPGEESKDIWKDDLLT